MSEKLHIEIDMQTAKLEEIEKARDKAQRFADQMENRVRELSRLRFEKNLHSPPQP